MKKRKLVNFIGMNKIAVIFKKTSRYITYDNRYIALGGMNTGDYILRPRFRPLSIFKNPRYAEKKADRNWFEQY